MLQQNVNANNGIYDVPRNLRPVATNNNNYNNNSGGGSASKRSSSRPKCSVESNVWLAINAQGLKLFERGGKPGERTELAAFLWRDVQTLSYTKTSLIVHSKLNGKRCKFKLKMDHRK